MAEGFFHPNALAIPNLDAARLSGAMVRILPKTRLVLDLVATSQEAMEMARNESMPDGSECWYRFFTHDDLARVQNPSFNGHGSPRVLRLRIRHYISRHRLA
ncbi:MAG: hypothetical protein IPO19_13720 [Rhodoferax sp.]|nr:hypothetical protein [Rhodoferax sp.]